jgi:2-polyprenyl-3-methyl-5-hydroxy-6-metoxy-1,4-benzoquinol methylase
VCAVRGLDMISSIPDSTRFGWDQVDPFNEKDNHLWMKLEHLGHYLFAADFLKQYQPKVIADISCGLGCGIPELARAAQTIIAVDSSQEMIDKASKRSENFNARFLNINLDREDLTPVIEAGSVDAVVSFETIEHLVDPNRAIFQFSQILQPGGFFICSVPNALSEPRARACLPRNKCHRQLFNFGSLSRMAHSHGLQVKYRLGQSWSYALLKREQQLASAKLIGRRLSDVPEMHTPEMIRLLSYILAYPTVEDVDGSYSIIIVAQKPSTSV